MENEGFVTVQSKKTIKMNRYKDRQLIRETEKQEKEKREEAKRKRRFLNDLCYLKTHEVFQKYRLKEEDVAKLVRKRLLDKVPEGTGTLYLLSGRRCVGHPILVTQDSHTCLQCSWEGSSKAFHCCCPIQVKEELPENFYMGCDGPMDTILPLL